MGIFGKEVFAASQGCFDIRFGVPFVAADCVRFLNHPPTAMAELAPHKAGRSYSTSNLGLFRHL